MANKETSPCSHMSLDGLFPRISLPFVNCDAQKIRFMSLLPDNQVEISEHISESTGIPLFIGCDVLSGCCQAPSNYARIHARYSKLGLATKLVLKDFGIEGMKKGSAFWFYNIEGLFRVIFECQDRRTQKSVITNLTNLWMERFNDKGLKEEYTVVIKKDSLLKIWRSFPVSAELAQNSDFVNQRESTNKQNTADQKEKNDKTMSIHKRETTHEQNSLEQQRQKNDETTLIPQREVTHELTSLVHTDKELDTFEKVGLQHSTCFSTDRRHGVLGENFVKIAVTSKKVVEKKCGFSKVDVGIQTDGMDFGKQVINIVSFNSNIKNSKQNNVDNIGHLTSNLSSTNSKADVKMRTNAECPKCSMSVFKENQNYGQCFKNLIKNMKYFIDKFANCKTDSWFSIKAIVELLQYEYQYDENSTLKTGFPFEVIDLYLREIENLKNNSVAEFKETLTKRDIFLCTISSWLGKEYHKFQYSISDKVEKFKTDYITCIDDLPQSETIVGIIFPKCMQELLKSWIGCEEVLHESLPVLEDDHSYVSPCKKTKLSEENCNSSITSIPYPLIQLILEFANKALVSGVAHVVYSKVCQAV